MTASATPARRRRGPRRLVIALVVVAALVAGAWIAVDTVGRGIATDVVADRLASALGQSRASVAVDLGDGSLVPQLVTARVDRVTVTIDDGSLGGLAGDARIVARGVPLDTAAATEALEASVVLAPEAVQALVRQQPDLAEADVTLLDGGVRLDTTATVLGTGIPVSVTADAVADEGALLLTPTAASVAGVDFDIEALRDSPFASLVDTVAGPQRVCVASSLPAALSLASVVVRPSGATAAVSARDVVLADLGSDARGSC